jgi:predicted ATPase/DNA-binding SARP family transcriptional activator
VEFRILGPLQVVDGRRELPLGSPKERELLALLLLRAGAVVSRERLIEELWGESPPPTAGKALNVYVSQLRKTLARNGDSAIATRPPGYVLEVEPERVDAARFERLVAEARERVSAGDVAAASRLLREALALWRGPALHGIELEAAARNEIGRLDELRLAAQMDRIDCELSLGFHEQLLGELEALVVEQPLRERLRGQLMLALYRSGRQADALRCYREARETLVGELGIEPSMPLQRLERAILNQDPALEAPAGIPRSALARSSQHLHAEVMRDEGRLGPAEAEESRIAARWRLRCLDAASVPVEGHSLVGRDRELRDLVGLLSDSTTRPVTLTGTGGTGKTRLALEVAAKLAHEFVDGAFFVPVAGLREPGLVASAIASTLGVREFAELRSRRLLLLVDNFEHVLEAAPVISALRAVAPAVAVLVTSRAPLRIADEREYPLEPLAEADAVALLTERGRAVRPGFSPDDATREICRRLDGLPLALELAATQLRSLAPAALLDRLDPRLPLLTGGRRDAPERHRTLHATIAWSYDLLDRELQDLLARLAVFGGTFSVGAADAVAGATLDRLAGLVEASLVSPRERDRFFMLETIREFAAGLLESDGLAEVRERHAEFFVGLAEQANLTTDADGPMDHHLVIPELDNIRVALEWSLEGGRPDLGLRLAVALEGFWVTADPLEGIRWFERLLAVPDGVRGSLAAAALRVYGELISIAGDFERAERLWQESLAESRAAGDDGGAATGLFLLAICAGRRGDYATAEKLAEQSLELHQRAGSRKGEAQVRGMFAQHARLAGEHERGLELLDEAIGLAREAGFPWWEKNELCYRAEWLLELGRPNDAKAAAHEALQIATRIGDRVGQIDALAILAHIASARAEPKIAGRLWGAIEAEAKSAPFPGWERTRRLHAGAILASDEFDIARKAGARLTLQTAVDEVLEQRLE